MKFLRNSSVFFNFEKFQNHTAFLNCFVFVFVKIMSLQSQKISFKSFVFLISSLKIKKKRTTSRGFLEQIFRLKQILSASVHVCNYYFLIMSFFFFLLRTAHSVLQIYSHFEQHIKMWNYWHVYANVIVNILKEN